MYSDLITYLILTKWLKFILSDGVHNWKLLNKAVNNIITRYLCTLEKNKMYSL